VSLEPAVTETDDPSLPVLAPAEIVTEPPLILEQMKENK